jgi:hypothetical protein
MQNYSVNELDLFFISYDEPNAELHWADLLTKAPWAKRIDGVKGHDEAFRLCGRNATTDYLFTVDGDSIVDPAFFEQRVDLDPINISSDVLIWKTRNVVNQLNDINGGIKLWPKKLLINLGQAHRTEDNNLPIISYNDIVYVHMHNLYSQCNHNGSALQAFRAGFRQSVKLSISRSTKDIERLAIWCSVGAEVEYGIWAIYGARLACFMVNFTDWDSSSINDYDWFDQFWSDHKDLSHQNLIDKISGLGDQLRQMLKLNIAELNSQQSKFYKFIEHRLAPKEFMSTAAEQPLLDIIFLSYRENNAEQKWSQFSKRFPRAQRVHGVKGIHQAHIHGAKMAKTKYFYVVDADAEIADSFDFSYYPQLNDKECVHVWRSKNAVNGLEYGYGGVKLFPRNMVLKSSTTSVDFTTSISKNFKIMQQLASATRFNTTPFEAWKSGFREAAKLTSGIIDRSHQSENRKRLNIWLTKGRDQEFGSECIAGARCGNEYIKSGGDITRINDFDWVGSPGTELEFAL